MLLLCFFRIGETITATCTDEDKKAGLIEDLESLDVLKSYKEDVIVRVKNKEIIP